MIEYFPPWAESLFNPQHHSKIILENSARESKKQCKRKQKKREEQSVMKHSRKKHLNNTLNVDELNNQLKDRGCLAGFKNHDPNKGPLYSPKYKQLNIKEWGNIHIINNGHTINEK